MFRVKFEYNADLSVAKYTLLQDDVEYDEECQIELSLPFDSAFSLSKLFDTVMMISREDGHNALIDRFQKFINNEYKM
jgi:hypothetical protein